MSFLTDYRKQLTETIASLDLAALEQAIDWMRHTRDSGGTIFTCGNGGSASTASHFACDLVKGASYQRGSRFRVMALTDSMPTISAYSNDVGHEVIFGEQLKNLARSGDLLIAISGSGNSPNVLEAAKVARQLGCRSISLTGRGGGKLAGLCDCNVLAHSQHMGVIEDLHMIACHMLAYYFMETEVARA